MSESVTQQSDPPTLSEIVMGLHEKQRAILNAIATAPLECDGVESSESGEGSVVRTTFLTRATDYSNDTVGHHAGVLIQKDLIERVEADETPHSPGRFTPNAYRCTEQGVAAAGLSDSPPVGDSLEALHLKIEQLNRKIEEQQDTIDHVTTQHNKLIERVNEQL